MCGIFGIHDHVEAANIAYLGLHALQHRGQESAGIVSNEEGTLHGVRAMGRVVDVFNEAALDQLPGRIAIPASRHIGRPSWIVGPAPGGGRTRARRGWRGWLWRRPSLRGCSTHGSPSGPGVC